MFKFITNRPFWVNILAVGALTLLLLFLFLKMLGWLTQHGEHLTVPNVLGKKTEEAITMLEKQGFEVRIQDSIFTDTAARGIVLKQLPDPAATVKINRTVFLTVNRVLPPMIDMPKLEGQTLSFAMDMLKRNHLKLGDTIYKPDFMMGSVLEQQYNGRRIPEKTKIRWGSKITLIIGGGLENQEMRVPSVVGMTFDEASSYLNDIGISIGAIISTGVIRDTGRAYIYQQNPERFDEEGRPQSIQSGQVMDLWISAEKRIKKSKDSLNTKNKKSTDNDY